jgi:hypothetical protein
VDSKITTLGGGLFCTGGAKFCTAGTAFLESYAKIA